MAVGSLVSCHSLFLLDLLLAFFLSFESSLPSLASNNLMNVLFFSLSICRYYRCISSNDCAQLSPEETVNDRNFSTPYPADPSDDGWNTAKFDLTEEDWSRAEPGPHSDCCKNLEEGWRCRPDKNHCHRYVVNDETALSADVGFMFDFQVKSCLKIKFLR